jgi:hypothetical protein
MKLFAIAGARGIRKLRVLMHYFPVFAPDLVQHCRFVLLETNSGGKFFCFCESKFEQEVIQVYVTVLSVINYLLAEVFCCQ